MREQARCFCSGIRHRSNTRFNGYQRWVLALAVAVCLLASTPSEAQQREFAATYRVLDVAQTGDNVTFTLALKIVNNSGEGLFNAESCCTAIHSRCRKVRSLVLFR